jgi:hypothetical protein
MKPTLKEDPEVILRDGSVGRERSPKIIRKIRSRRYQKTVERIDTIIKCRCKHIGMQLGVPGVEVSRHVLLTFIHWWRRRKRGVVSTFSDSLLGEFELPVAANPLGEIRTILRAKGHRKTVVVDGAIWRRYEMMCEVRGVDPLTDGLEEAITQYCAPTNDDLWGEAHGVPPPHPTPNLPPPPTSVCG